MKFEEWWSSIGGNETYHTRVHNRPFMLKILAREIWEASQIHGSPLTTCYAGGETGKRKEPNNCPEAKG